MTRILQAETKTRDQIEAERSRAEIASLISRLETLSDTIPASISDKLESSLKSLSDRKLELVDNQTVKIDEIQSILDSLGSVLSAIQSIGTQTEKVSEEVHTSAIKLAGEVSSTKDEIIAALQSLGAIIHGIGSDRPIIEIPEQINQKRLFRLLEDIKKAIQEKKSGGTSGVILSGGGTALNAATSTKQDEQTARLEIIAQNSGLPISIKQGMKPITLIATGEQLADPEQCKRAIVQSSFGNSGYITIGGEDVAANTGVQLVPGQAIDFEVSDIGNIYVLGTAPGDIVRFTYFV